MKTTIIFLAAALMTSAPASAMAQTVSPSGSGQLSCPPDYMLSIDPPPKPASAENAKPLSGAEQGQTEEQATANELARWHCIPMTGDTGGNHE